jgi:helix-hairpin-helix protein
MKRAVAAAVLLLALLGAPGCRLWHHGATTDAPVPIDLNRATVRAVEELPGITPSMAARIVAGRPYGSPDDLVDRHILTRRELDRIGDRIVVLDPTPKR